MPTPHKVQVVADLSEKMSQMQLAVIADYRGLNVAEISDLRRKMRESGGDMVVAKNTLLRIAARETGHEGLEPLLAGPTAITFAYDDPSKVAKAINDYARGSKNFTVRGGMLGTSVIAADGLEQVEKMPSRESLYASIAGGVQSPMAGLVGVLNAPASDLVGALNAAITGVMYALQARADQLQTEGRE